MIRIGRRDGNGIEKESQDRTHLGLVRPFYSDQNPLNANHMILHHITILGPSEENVTALAVCIFVYCLAIEAVMHVVPVG